MSEPASRSSRQRRLVTMSNSSAIATIRATLVPAETQLAARHIGLLAIAGLFRVPVDRWPRVRILLAKDDPRTQELAAHADRYVACFGYADMMAGIPLHDDQGTYDRPHKLTVYFDPARINALLAQLGDRPWRGERPVVVPLLLVHGPKPPPYLLSAEIPAGEEQRGSFATAAGQFGIHVRIPNDAELVARGASVDHLPSFSPPLRGGEAVVTGTLDWSETLPGWVGKDALAGHRLRMGHQRRQLRRGFSQYYPRGHARRLRSRST